jgi:hypothetical protein
VFVVTYYDAVGFSAHLSGIYKTEEEAEARLYELRDELEATAVKRGWDSITIEYWELGHTSENAIWGWGELERGGELKWYDYYN